MSDTERNVPGLFSCGIAHMKAECHLVLFLLVAFNSVSLLAPVCFIKLTLQGFASKFGMTSINIKTATILI